MKILLYGYYNKGNFGDNLFEIIFKKYFDSINIKYILSNPDDLNINYKINKDINFIFLGGGEIINDYFMIPLFKYIKYHNLYNISIYGASIGYNSNYNMKYLNFLDKCIFRNDISIVDNINYFYDNDIVFSLSNFYSPKNNNIKYNTFGYYLINEIDTNYYNILKNLTIYISKKYIINFYIFEQQKDILIINKLINDCNLINYMYNIININDPLELINNISQNEKHLCMRYHSHIICYLYKYQFISFPLTNKTIDFNINNNIYYSFNLNDIINLIDNQNIIFKNLYFNFDILNNFVLSNKINTNKILSLWSIIYEIYHNFMIIYNNKNELCNDDIIEYIKYISDQIELNIIGILNTKFRDGIYIKIKNLLLNKKYINIENKFITIITNLIK